MLLSAKKRTSNRKKRNSHKNFKVKVRKLVSCGPDDLVFDVFAGDGEMYRHCWKHAGGGATCDIEDSCVEIAAKERHDAWTVVKVNVDKALRYGIFKDHPFSIVDIDCYGSPWKFLTGMFSRTRELTDPCTLILTDHYMAQRNIARSETSLFFSPPGTPDDYLRCGDLLLKKTVVAQGWSYDRKLYRDGKAVQHVITLRR